MGYIERNGKMVEIKKKKKKKDKIIIFEERHNCTFKAQNSWLNYTFDAR